MRIGERSRSGTAYGTRSRIFQTSSVHDRLGGRSNKLRGKGLCPRGSHPTRETVMARQPFVSVRKPMAASRRPRTTYPQKFPVTVTRIAGR